MKRYRLDPDYPRALAWIGVDPAQALRKAGVAEDLFAHEHPTMSAEDYFAFMRAVGDLAPGEEAAIAASSVEGVERFAPPIFAAYCAKNGRAFLERLGRYKRLIGPMALRIAEGGGAVRVGLECPEVDAGMPAFLVRCELCFLVHMLRSATKEKIVPRRVLMREAPESEGFADFFGVPVSEGAEDGIVFSADDLELPFVSRNDAMLAYLEPEIGRRLSALDVEETTAVRVRSVLGETLAGGETGIDEVARRLGVSARTLQRKLLDEGTSFSEQLKTTREALASHYLRSSAMSVDEIAYLLGYQELNSFLRAFRSWTGTSPAAFRRSLAG